AGMSQADFEAALKDPAVQETLEKWKAAYDVAKIQGVPAYVVNTGMRRKWYSYYSKAILHRQSWNAFPASSPVGWLNEFWRATPR
ncbi:hypothetical protein ONJ17_26265, partial [Salmonella enterica subsp. enterica serovar Agona]|nr:hypothetical protein [Salmonella enterica subsp. enterica serovar Agona]